MPRVSSVASFFGIVLQVTNVTIGTTTNIYVHDAAGRRVKATQNGGSERRFLVASTPGSDLESPQLIADSGNALKHGYVFVGDDPLLRFDSTNGNGRVYYLEDGMGSVIGLTPQTSPTTNNTTRLFYDGFGRTRATNGPAPTIPTGTGGDFRFHGLWLEDTSGLYHIRARDYDPRTGRFLSRDPEPGNFRSPETLHPYNYAAENPFLYSDPSGEFTLIEINISSSIQGGLQGFRAAAVQRGRAYISRKIGEFAMNQFFNVLKSFIPINEDMLGTLLNGSNSKFEGFRFVAFAKEFLCEQIGLPDSIWFEPQIGRDGDVVNNGLNCSSKGSLRPRLGPVPRPDFVISPSAPLDLHSGRHSRAWLVGELKLSTQGIMRSYIKPKTQPGQLLAILKYARKHTIPRVFVVATLLRNPNHEKIIRQVLTAEAAREGVVGIVFTLQ